MTTTPHAYPHSMHTSHDVAAAFKARTGAHLSRVLCLCTTAWLATSCGNGSDTESQATAAGGAPGEGTQTAASPGGAGAPIATPGDMTTDPTPPNVNGGAPAGARQ
jgi:hypothetical protein